MKQKIKVHDRVVCPNGEPAVVSSLTSDGVAQVIYDRMPTQDWGTSFPLEVLVLITAASD